MIVAQGSRFGGYTMLVKDTELVFVHNSIGIPPAHRVADPAPKPGRHVVGVNFRKQHLGEHHETYATLSLYIDDEVVAESQIRTQLGRYALTGEGLSVGCDSGDVVTPDYPNRFAFTGGTIHKVVYDVAEDHYIDVEREFEARLATD